MSTSLHWNTTGRAVLVMLAMGALPTLAYAHPGAGGGWAHGLAHPLGGMDHLCAMLAVGLWAAQLGGRALWAMPLTFVSFIVLGGLLGMAALPLPLLEGGIVTSVLVLGALSASAIRLPLLFGAMLVGTFALFHGFAHGAEMPHGAFGLTYALGFMSTTLLLLVSGVALGKLVRENQLRLVGATVTVFGGYLAFVA